MGCPLLDLLSVSSQKPYVEWKGGGSFWSRRVVRFSEAGNRKLQRQFGRRMSFVCRTRREL